LELIWRSARSVIRPSSVGLITDLIFHNLPLQSSLFSLAVLLLHTALLQLDFPTEAALEPDKVIINKFRRILNLLVKIISHKRLIPDFLTIPREIYHSNRLQDI
jgi:hypothetical protein